jgi:anti-sigma factor RsiW
MGRLSPADALHFENHCSTCRPCAAATKQAERFVRALRGAACQLAVESHDELRLRCRASLTVLTPTPLGGARAKMRFYMTSYAPPRKW